MASLNMTVFQSETTFILLEFQLLTNKLGILFYVDGIAQIDKSWRILRGLQNSIKFLLSPLCIVSNVNLEWSGNVSYFYSFGSILVENPSHNFLKTRTLFNFLTKWSEMQLQILWLTFKSNYFPELSFIFKGLPICYLCLPNSFSILCDII